MKKLIFGLIVLIASLSLQSCSERIDSGHTGIKVNLYGDDKGVDDVTEVTGRVWYNPFTTEIFESPNYVQNVVWTADDREGSEDNEEFLLSTKDGMKVRMDISLNYRVESQNTVKIFKKYRKPLNIVGATVLRTYARDGYNTAASYFTAEEMYADRKHFQEVADSIVRNSLEPEGFTIEKLVLVSIRLPESVKNAIESKVKAKQIALQKEQELAQSRADAEKRIEDARGYAEAMKIKADGQRYAYEQKQRSLTKLLVQQQYVEKWNGVLPIYGTVPTMFKSVQ